MNASLTIQPARRISTRQALRAAPPRPVYQAPDRARRQRAARRRHRVAAAALLACTYLRHNIPVVIWATMEMRPVEAGTQWTLPDGEVFTWPSGEHCLLLVGETAEGYLLNDPRAGETVCYDKELVRRRYESLGSQAVALVPVR